MIMSIRQTTCLQSIKRSEVTRHFKNVVVVAAAAVVVVIVIVVAVVVAKSHAILKM